jgi:hypothetical protein
MKRVLKFKVVAALFMGLLFTTTSFTFGPVGDVQLVGDPPQKKEQKVKIVVSTDGKVTKIDTTFNLPDEKMIQVKVDSMLQKMELEGIGPDMKNIVIHRGGKHLKWSSRNGDKFPGEEQFDIMIQCGDSGQAKHMRKIVCMGGDGNINFSDVNESDELLPPPPPPPPPPFPEMMFQQQFGDDTFAFDSKDNSIISYDKKDIGKGLEKITIIRKKQTEHKKREEVDVKTEVSGDTK